MSLNLLIDEDSQDKILVGKLKLAGHDVLTVNEAGLHGQADTTVLAFAVANIRVVLTRNCDDFCGEAQALKGVGAHHFGVLLWYERHDPAKDMSYDDVVRAVGNIDKAISKGELVLEDREISLSYYRY